MKKHRTGIFVFTTILLLFTLYVLFSPEPIAYLMKKMFDGGVAV
ncbi:hypothetical protein MKX79_04310 [Viridibacillus sp. FSL R5-0468]